MKKEKLEELKNFIESYEEINEEKFEYGINEIKDCYDGEENYIVELKNGEKWCYYNEWGNYEKCKID